MRCYRDYHVSFVVHPIHEHLSGKFDDVEEKQVQMEIDLWVAECAVASIEMPHIVLFVLVVLVYAHFNLDQVLHQ